MEKAVAAYFASPEDIDKGNLDVGAVLAVYKLHPHAYFSRNGNPEWLIAACLRQNKFVQ